jgi:hypothetical protein
MFNLILTNKPMRNISVKQFMTEFGFVEICKDVRENKNHYPFLTFMDADNQATNIYFSVGAAANVTKGLLVDKDLISKHQITIYTMDGEERVKISRIGDGSSNRITFDDLFG